MESLCSEKMRWSAQHRISPDDVPVWCPLTAAHVQTELFFLQRKLCVRMCARRVHTCTHMHDMYAWAARACYRHTGTYMRL